MAITINGSGTITGVSAGGLPDGSVDADTLASTLDLSGKTMTYGLTDSDLSSVTTGKVLQIVAVNSTTQTEHSLSYSTCYPEASITPSSTGSNILIIYNTGGMALGTVNAINLILRRDGSGISERERYGYHADSSWGSIPITYTYIDSPSTTSEVTYTVQARKQSGGTLETNSSGGTASASMILMEIAG